MRKPGKLLRAESLRPRQLAHAGRGEARLHQSCHEAANVHGPVVIVVVFAGDHSRGADSRNGYYCICTCVYSHVPM